MRRPRQRRRQALLLLLLVLLLLIIAELFARLRLRPKQLMLMLLLLLQRGEQRCGDEGAESSRQHPLGRASSHLQQHHHGVDDSA